MISILGNMSRKYLINILTIGIAAVTLLSFAANVSAMDVKSTENFSFRVMTSTEYVETSAIAVGDINGDGKNEIVVSYDEYMNDAYANLSAYDVDGNHVSRIANLENFYVGPKEMYVDPINVFIERINETPYLFITGTYNENKGVYVFKYNETNESFDVVQYFQYGTDCAILTYNKTTYLAVAGDEIYKVKNGTFVPIQDSEIVKGFIRTGHFSNDSNIAVFDGNSGAVTFYNFSNESLELKQCISLNIPTPGFGNDARDYVTGFNVGHITNSTYDELVFVTYHNGYTVVDDSNGTPTQIVTGVLNIDGDFNAMTSVTAKLYNFSTDCVVIGFDNDIYAPLYEVYHYENGTLNAVSGHGSEDGNTRVITAGDIDGDGHDEIILGSDFDGYIRIFSETTPTPIPEISMPFLIAVIIPAFFLSLKRKHIF